MSAASLTQPEAVDYAQGRVLTTSLVKCAHCASEMVSQIAAHLTEGGAYILLKCETCREHTGTRVHGHDGTTLVQVWRATAENIARRSLTP